MMVHKRIERRRDGMSTRGISVAAGLLVTAACGANEPFTDLFPDTDGGLEATVGTVEAPSAASQSAPPVADAGTSAATSSGESAESSVPSNVSDTSVKEQTDSNETSGASSAPALDTDTGEHGSNTHESVFTETTELTSVPPTTASTPDSGASPDPTTVVTLDSTTTADDNSQDETGSHPPNSSGGGHVTFDDSTSAPTSTGTGTDWSLPLDSNASTADAGINDGGDGEDASPDAASLDDDSDTGVESAGDEGTSAEITAGETEVTDESTTEADVSTGPASACGNGVLEEAEACCTPSVITSELDARSLATEGALESALTCAPTQNGSTNSGWPRLTYSLCTGTCESGGVGCDTALSNTSVVYDPATNTLFGYADITLTGELQWANAYWNRTCDLVLTLTGVEFTADVAWSDDLAQIEVYVTNLDVAVDASTVSGCTPARPAARAVADVDLEVLVRPALEAGLAQEFAGELTCPY